MQKIKLPGDKNQKEIIEEMIRVNHAGEYGAKRIYEGQISANKSPCCKLILEHMLAQEEEHLIYFSNLLLERKIRPSILNPIWHIGGYLLGNITSRMDKKAAMACTEAVENVIDEHYQEQLKFLHNTSEKELEEKIEQFRQEEIEHRDIAVENEAHFSPIYDLLTSSVKTISKISIWLAKRF